MVIKIILIGLLSWFFGYVFMFYPAFAAMLLSTLVLILIFIKNQKVFLLLVGILLIMQPLLGVLRIPLVGQIDEFLLLLTLLMVLCRKLIKMERFSTTPIYALFLGILLIGVISSMRFHYVPLYIALGGFLLFFKGLFFLYIFASIPYYIKDINIILKTFLVLGLLIAVYGVLGAFVPKIFLAPLGISSQITYLRIPALQSFFGHPGAFSAFMAVCAVFAFAQYWIKGQKKFLLLNLFFVICMILSFRRTSILGYFIAVLIVLFWRGAPKPLFSVRRGLIILMLVFVILAFSGTLIKMYGDLYEGYVLGGISPRSLLAFTGIEIAVDKFPLGTGFGTYASGINRYFYSPLFYEYRLFTKWGLSENEPNFTNDTFWPHILVETGFIGFFLYLAIIVILIRITMKTLRLVVEPDRKTFVLGTFMMMLVSLIESLKATFYESSLWAYLYFGAMGICMGWYFKYREHLSQET